MHDWVGSSNYLLRNLVWTGDAWFAYFENCDQNLVREFRWNDQLYNHDSEMNDNLNANLDVKVIAYGDGQWFVYYEQDVVS